jgi:hypothetical protein
MHFRTPNMPFWKFLRDSVSYFPLRLLRLQQPLRLLDTVSAGSIEDELQLRDVGIIVRRSLCFEDSRKGAEFAINGTGLQIRDVQAENLRDERIYVHVLERLQRDSGTNIGPGSDE